MLTWTGSARTLNEYKQTRVPSLVHSIERRTGRTKANRAKPAGAENKRGKDKDRVEADWAVCSLLCALCAVRSDRGFLAKLLSMAETEGLSELDVMAQVCVCVSACVCRAVSSSHAGAREHMPWQTLVCALVFCFAGYLREYNLSWPLSSVPIQYHTPCKNIQCSSQHHFRLCSCMQYV